MLMLVRREQLANGRRLSQKKITLLKIVRSQLLMVGRTRLKILSLVNDLVMIWITKIAK